jgi:hypothetical protein
MTGKQLKVVCAKCGQVVLASKVEKTGKRACIGCKEPDLRVYDPANPYEIGERWPKEGGE